MNSTVFNKKNRNAIIIVAVILIIPAILAVYFGLHSDTDAVKTSRMTEISVSAPDGSVTTLADDASFELYAKIIENARLIDENFRDLSEETPYVVTILEDDGLTRSYNFYMKNDVSACIFTDEAEKYYMLTENDAQALLGTDLFASVNTNAVVPYAAVTVGSNVTIIEPAGGTWCYLNANGEYESKDITSSADKPLYKISVSSIGDLTFYSEAQPDNVTVLLSQNGVVKHEGAYENMLNADVMSANDTYYDLVINAEWLQKDGSSYYGTATYYASVLYDVAPSYTLIYNGVVSKGDFTILKMQNFNDGEKLYAQCDYPLPEELKVFKSDSGDYSYAFVPADYTSAASGTYTLTLSLEDGASQTLQLKVRDGRAPSVTSQELFVTDSNLQTTFTTETVAEYEEMIKKVNDSPSPVKLWDGKFLYPDASNTGIVGTGMADFGTVRNVHGLYSTNYVHNGIDVVMSDGASVYASNNGRIAFAGTLGLTGNTVVIDHGCSVYSYYFHLGSIAVEEGASVSKGGVIGTAGTSGFAVSVSGATCSSASQVHFAASVDGVFVNPYYLWKVGIDFGD